MVESYVRDELSAVTTQREMADRTVFLFFRQKTALRKAYGDMRKECHWNSLYKLRWTLRSSSVGGNAICEGVLTDCRE